MKKLMMVAAIVCAATAAQAAASFSWMAMNVKDRNGNKYAGDATLYAYYNDEVVASWTGKFNNGAITKIVSSESLVVGDYYKFEYTMTDSDNYVFTASYPGSIAAQEKSTPTVMFGSAGSWSAEPAVPEPTSGLLLLVGGMLLGLRRKRV